MEPAPPQDNQSSSTSGTLRFSHHYHPHWLHRSWLRQLTGDDGGDSPGELTPALSSPQWDNFWRQLQEIQSQLFEDPTRNKMCLKLEGDVAVPPVWGQLRILTSAAGGTRLVALPLIAAEEWTREGREWHFHYELAAGAVAALFGVGDRHTTLLENGALPYPQLLKQQPVVIAKDLWDLQSPLQRALMSRVLHGGARADQMRTLAQLFRGLPRPHSEAGSELAWRLKTLAQLGQQLNQSGYVLSAPTFGHFDQIPGEEFVTWLAQDPPPHSEKFRRYRALAAHVALQRQGTAVVAKILQVMRPSEATALEKFWQDMITRLRQRPLGAEAFNGQALDCGWLIHPLHLFGEWLCRAQFQDGPLALPVAVFHKIGCPAEATEENFFRWLQLFRSRQELFSHWLKQPWASVALGLQKEFANFVVPESSGKLSSASSALQVAVDKEPAAEAAKPPVNPTPQTEPPKKPEIPLSTFWELAGVEASNNREGATVSPDQVLQMRKLAESELRQLQKTDPPAYQSLRNDYMKSLSESSRSALLEFQQRLPAMEFKNQLDHKLVRYMLDNPGAWRTRLERPPTAVRSDQLPPHFGDF